MWRWLVLVLAKGLGAGGRCGGCARFGRMGLESRQGVAPATPALTTERIVSTALTLGLQKGFESLTMRSLARELGVTPMAFYHHVSGKRELLQLVVDEVFGDAEIVPPEFGDWDDRIAEMVRRHNEVFDRYPGLDTVVFQLEPSPKMSAIIDGYIQVLREAGFSVEQARLGFGVLHAASLGRLITERRVDDAEGDPSASDRDRLAGEKARRREFATELLVRGLRSLLVDPPPGVGESLRQAD